FRVGRDFQNHQPRRAADPPLRISLPFLFLNGKPAANLFANRRLLSANSGLSAARIPSPLCALWTSHGSSPLSRLLTAIPRTFKKISAIQISCLQGLQPDRQPLLTESPGWVFLGANHNLKKEISHAPKPSFQTKLLCRARAGHRGRCRLRPNRR